MRAGSERTARRLSNETDPTYTLEDIISGGAGGDRVDTMTMAETWVKTDGTGIEQEQDDGRRGNSGGERDPAARLIVCSL